MVLSDTARIGILRRAKESVTPPRVRYSDARRATKAFLTSPARDQGIIYAAMDAMEQRTDDPSESAFRQDDAQKSMDALNSLMRLRNQLGGYDFVPAPARPAKLNISGVEVSVNVDVLVYGASRGVEQIGGALFRYTRSDEESDTAAARRHERGLYAATLVYMQIAQNLAGNRMPLNRLCMAVDVQSEDIHIAPRNFARRRSDIENACFVIAGIWDRL